MPAFLHERVQRLGQQLAQTNRVLAKYNQADLDTLPALDTLLADTAATYEALQLPSAQNLLLTLRAELVAAQHGTDPATGQQLATQRRAMQRGVMLRLLQQAGTQLRTDIAADAAALDAARAQLRPMLLLGLKKHLVPHAHRKTLSHSALATLWQRLAAEHELHLAAQQLSLQSTQPDILLLLGELVAALLSDDLPPKRRRALSGELAPDAG